MQGKEDSKPESQLSQFKGGSIQTKNNDSQISQPVKIINTGPINQTLKHSDSDHKLKQTEKSGGVKSPKSLKQGPETIPTDPEKMFEMAPREHRVSTAH